MLKNHLDIDADFILLRCGGLFKMLQLQIHYAALAYWLH